MKPTEHLAAALCRHLVEHAPRGHEASRTWAGTHIESYKLALAAHVTAKGTPLEVNTLRMRLGMLLTFFDRIIEWGYEDAPVRCPVFISDIPRPDEPLPKALDDAAAARLPAGGGRESRIRYAASCSRSCARTGLGWESCARSRTTPWSRGAGAGG